MKKKQPKQRLDNEVALRGMAPSKEKAAAFIMAGDILVDGQVVYKPDTPVTPDNTIELKEKFPYASRGALKIQKALDTFDIDVKGLNVLDIGISTGGFSDYMLQNGAAHVTGIDVNVRQVDHKLRQNPQLTLIEANARHLPLPRITVKPDLITMDVSFISITKILPALSAFPNARIVSLIKPQFEAPPEAVDRGGIVRDPDQRTRVLMDLKNRISTLNYTVTAVTGSGIPGRKGNREYFFLLEYGKKPPINDTIISHVVKTEI